MNLDIVERQERDLLRSSGYKDWKAKVEATRGCLHPVRLSGAYRVTNRSTGALLHDHSGHILVPCGTRRAAVCPPCAERYSNDAFHLVRAGLSGDDTKNVPADVAQAPRVFATLTAPSFGAVHTRRLSNRGRVIPCACGERHHADDPRPSTPIDPDTYDYEAAVLWQAHSGVLWHRFCMAVRRLLAKVGGVRVRDLPAHVVVSYAKVAEYQRRGLVHFHAVVRLDGPAGPGSTAPEWATTEILTTIVRQAAASVEVTSHRPTGEVLTLAWGDRVDVQAITGTAADDESPGAVSATALASYVAKYATKSTGTSDTGVDHRIKSRGHIDELRISAHYRRMMATAWDLGGMDSYEELNLRRWCHMLGFRGHFLTKSKQYSVTFTRIRAARQLHRVAELLDRLAVVADDVDIESGWEFGGVGHRNDAERDLAVAIGERLLAQRTSRKE